jgi:hypothetical protein
MPELGRWRRQRTWPRFTKIFWCFFSKKNRLLTLMQHLATKTLLLVLTPLGVGAIYYATFGPDWLRVLLVLLFAGIAGGAVLFIPARTAILLWLAANATLLAWYATDPPRNDRDWATEYAIPASVSLDGPEITIHNIRNFSYRSATDPIPAYYDAQFRLDQLSSVDLVSSYWAGERIAHVFLTFGFSDGRHLAISIETRRQKKYPYSVIAGFFHHYELFYVVADERDLIGVRTDIRHERVYLYRLQIPRSAQQALLLDYLAEVQKLDARPRWYNTLTANCTTGILQHARANHDII